MRVRLLVVPVALFAAALLANRSPVDSAFGVHGVGIEPPTAVLLDAASEAERAGLAVVAELQQPPAATADVEGREIEGCLGRAQTFAAALSNSGLTDPQVGEAIAALRGVFDFRTAREGTRFMIRVAAADGRLAHVRLEHGARERVEATRDGDRPLVGRRIELPVETRLEAVGGEIEGSLYASLQRRGETPELAAALAEVFAWDIDFYRDQHPGDRFRVLVEKQFANGELIGYGRILAAEYDGRIGTHRTFWFAPGGNHKQADYFLEDGRSARKLFLATPLQFTRVSSSFSPNRRHPILGYNRAHLGVDYAASRGTPVRAMASGTVIVAGRDRGSGNIVKIRHRGGLVSAYAHLHWISPGIRVGSTVTQKQTIGAVGSTGLATGPHLHFAVQKDGRYVNPQRLDMSRLESVAAAFRPAFDRTVAEQVGRLAAVEIDDRSTTAIASLLDERRGLGPQPMLD